MVDAVSDGDRALSHLHSYEYDAVIMDWRMPGTPGIDVVRETRRRGSRVPIIMLTARDTTQDRVQGLDAGADDYLVKPFQLVELLARLRALQRRPALTLPPILALGDLELDPSRHEMRRAGKRLSLTSRELSIVELLLRRQPSVVDRRTLAVQVWQDEASAVGSNTIDVHMARLRAKLTGSTARIETVRGVGYRIVAPPGAAAGASADPR